MVDTAILLTTYNRPTLVAQAIRSVASQDCAKWRLYILDDGSNEETRNAIRSALETAAGSIRSDIGVVAGVMTQKPDLSPFRIVWWQGPQRDLWDRKQTISYSCTINHALNFLVQDEKYITFLCDDDVLTPQSVSSRRTFLEKNLEANVCFGRLRSVQFGADGSRNNWNSVGDPKPINASFVLPRGQVEWLHGGKASRVYYAPEQKETDPDTRLPFVECGLFIEGPSWYGPDKDGQIDHNQAMMRASCLNSQSEWYGQAKLGGIQYWGEPKPQHDVGDAAFFRLLGKHQPFYGVDAWVCSKSYHRFSDGLVDGAVRE